MKKFAIEFKWGIIFTVVSLLWIVFERLLGWHSSHIDKHAVYTNFFALPAILVFVFALLDKRKHFYNNKMTWMQGFIAGLVVSIFVAVLSPMAQFITIEWITPDFFTNAREYVISVGKMSAEQAAEYFNLTNYMMQSAFGAILMGAITSAIVALFVRKK
ncbi:DUF4199 domain-containing protein [Maribellus maritimus]|uniref:DUF4199 domain-containing protein n=1 Tax=Maribellus maritimus TaxID=2870838 RepID=UPI001EEB8C6C|nr:DUF4199 domain-containing protein [Maribellus maritimus]MCG6188008.1 DUF4199 domain-containing protein [Maribellus maritimus]